MTVAGSFSEILRREPDVFVRTAPDWLGEWLRKFLRDDDVYRATTDDPSSSRFLMLDAAGFAPALRGAVTRASRARTARKLADALRDVLRDPDAATALVDDPARAARWRAAVRACLRKLLTHVKRRDQFDDGTCTCLWRCVDATVIRSSGSYLLSSDEVWDEITRADPDATVVTWAIGKISGAANDNDPTFENYSVVRRRCGSRLLKTCGAEASRPRRIGSLCARPRRHGPLVEIIRLQLTSSTRSSRRLATAAAGADLRGRSGRHSPTAYATRRIRSTPRPKRNWRSVRTAEQDLERDGGRGVRRGPGAWDVPPADRTTGTAGDRRRGGGPPLVDGPGARDVPLRRVQIPSQSARLSYSKRAPGRTVPGACQLNRPRRGHR